MKFTIYQTVIKYIYIFQTSNDNTLNMLNDKAFKEL